MGALSISQGPAETKATVSLNTSNNTLTITPKAAGTTTVILKEGNGNKTATINISVLATSITASPTSVTANVSDGNQKVTLGGTNHGTFTIVTQPNSSIATASISGSTLTIVPKAKGETSVVVKEGNGNKQITVKITLTDSIPTSESYVGNYADIDGDGTADGIIFADLAIGGSGTGLGESYSIPTVSGLKEYYIANENYTESKFGNKSGKLIATVAGTNGADRFYIMSLEDIKQGPRTLFRWYENAYGYMSDYSSTTSGNFGIGKTNTAKMIEKWDSNEYGLGNSEDMWGVIQNQVSEGWFVPSRKEWAVFGGNLKITTNNFYTYGLKQYYWSSSQYNAYKAYYAFFFSGTSMDSDVSGHCYVRLCITF